jgi:hypothetical protein
VDAFLNPRPLELRDRGEHPRDNCRPACSCRPPRPA